MQLSQESWGQFVALFAWIRSCGLFLGWCFWGFVLLDVCFTAAIIDIHSWKIFFIDGE
jgi:hypothetical protein